MPKGALDLGGEGQAGPECWPRLWLCSRWVGGIEVVPRKPLGAGAKMSSSPAPSPASHSGY